jgi:chemotaxis protein MotA
MDFATLLGLIVGTIVITLAILGGSDALIFVNVPGLLIVLGGTFAATLIKFPITQCMHAFVLGVQKAFRDQIELPTEIIALANHLSAKVRKHGILSLENEPIKNSFLQKGIQLCVDGRSPEFIRRVLMEDKERSIERHEVSEQIFRAIGDSAPAFGLIGTLVGLVQMLSSMDDPSSIGPAMAVALLTTLYGALFANLFALPIADKLKIRTQQEIINKTMVIESVLSIQKGENPRLIAEYLEVFVPSNKRNVLSKALVTEQEKQHSGKT